MYKWSNQGRLTHLSTSAYMCMLYVHPYSHNSDVHIRACTNVTIELPVQSTYIHAHTVLTCGTNMYAHTYMCVCVCACASCG